MVSDYTTRIDNNSIQNTKEESIIKDTVGVINAYVEKIDIKRALPNVLKIYVTERKIGYQIEYLNSKIYIDEQGYIITNYHVIENAKTIITKCSIFY